jgi:hypothetical protein
MDLRVLTKRERFLYPASTAVLAFVATQAAQAVTVAETRILIQALLVVWGVNDALYYVTNSMPREQEPEAQPVPEPTPTGFQRVHKVIPNLNVPVNTYQSVTLNVQQQDLRWRHFAYAIVTHNTPMTQTKWTGKNRPFSKPEFEYQMQGWLSAGVVAPKNRKGNTGGFKPNGAGGWQYFADLANGKRWIALPHQD